jgi:hypothetical protein
MAESVAFEFHCAEIPSVANLFLALQEGTGLVQAIPTSESTALFRFMATVRPSKLAGKSDFGGACIQGTPDSRFVYLCWCVQEGGLLRMTMRAKISLQPLTAEQVNLALRLQAPLQAQISLSNEKGRPATGTLKPDKVLWQV